MKKLALFCIGLIITSILSSQVISPKYVSILNGDHINPHDNIFVHLFLDGILDYEFDDLPSPIEIKVALCEEGDDIVATALLYFESGLSLHKYTQLVQLNPDEEYHKPNNTSEIYSEVNYVNSLQFIGFYSDLYSSNRIEITPFLIINDIDYAKEHYLRFVVDGNEIVSEHFKFHGGYQSMQPQVYPTSIAKFGVFGDQVLETEFIVEASSPKILYELNGSDYWNSIDRIISAKLVVRAFDVNHAKEALVKTVNDVPLGYLQETGDDEWGTSVIDIPASLIASSGIPILKLENTASWIQNWSYEVDSVALILEYIHEDDKPGSITGGWKPDSEERGRINGDYLSSSAGIAINNNYYIWHSSFDNQLSNYVQEVKAARITITAEDIDFEEADLYLNDNRIPYIPSTGDDQIKTYQISIPEAFLSQINTSGNNSIKIAATGIGAGKFTVYHMDFSIDYDISTGPPPELIGLSPGNNETGVASNTNIVALFSKEVDFESFTTSTFIIRNEEGYKYPFHTTAGNDRSEVIINPNLDLYENERVDIEITTGIKDLFGTSLVAGTTSSFYTDGPDLIEPTITEIVPANNSGDIELTGQEFQITFSEPINTLTFKYPDMYLSGNKRSDEYPLSVQWNSSKTIATISSPSYFMSDEQLLLHIGTGITDYAGNALDQTYEYTFNTHDYTAPDVPSGITTSPADKSVTVSWAANSESDLAGYNLYTRLANESYQKVNTNLITTTNFPVNGLNNFAHYYFKVSAVDDNGNESILSSSVEEIPYKTGPNNISGTYSYNITLVSEGSPYNIVGDFTVNNEASLVIEDGVTVNFLSASYQLFLNEATFSAAGVSFSSSSETYISILEGNSNISSCDFDGVYINVKDPEMVLENSGFDNVNIPIVWNLENPVIQPTITGLTFGEGVIYPGISLRAYNAIGTEFTVPDYNYPYYIFYYGYGSINIGSSGALTLAEGNEIYFITDRVFIDVSGSLNVNNVSFNSLEQDDDGYYPYINVFADGSINVSDCTFDGVYINVKDPEMVLENSSFDNVNVPLVWDMEDPVSQPTIAGLTFGEGVIYPGISLRAYNAIGTEFTVPDYNYPYYIFYYGYGSINIGSSGALTLAEGNEIYFITDRVFIDVSGSLNVNNVSFNSLEQDDDGYYPYINVFAEGSINVSDCTFDGVYINAKDPEMVLENSSFDNVNVPLVWDMEDPVSQPTITGLNFGEGVIYPGISLRAYNAIGTEFTVPDYNYPYYIFYYGYGSINIGSSGALTLADGNEIYFITDRVFIDVSGSLNVNNVSFNSLEQDDDGYYPYINVFADGSINVSDCTFDGVYINVKDPEMVLENSSFDNVNVPLVWDMEDPVSQPTITGLTFGEGVIYPGINLRAYNAIGTEFTVPDYNYPYYIFYYGYGSINIGSSGALTLAEGNEIYFITDRVFIDVSGSLNVNNVSFNSLEQDDDGYYPYINVFAEGSINVSDCTFDGVYINAKDPEMVLENSSFDNVNVPLVWDMEDPVSQPTIAGLTFGEGVIYPGISLRAYNAIGTEFTVPDYNYPYYIFYYGYGSINIGSSGALTLAEGNEIYFITDRVFIDVSGILNVNNVSFNSLEQDDDSYYPYINVLAEGSINVSDCTFDGVYINAKDPDNLDILSNRFKNSKHSISIENPLNSLIQTNEFLDVTLGIQNNGSTSIAATNNYWNHSSGPNASAIPDETRSGIDDNVTFDPWLLIPPFSPYKVQEIPDQELEEDFGSVTLIDDLSEYFEDGDNSTLTYRISLSDPILTAEISASSLILTSLESLTGTTQLVILAEDDFWFSSDTLIVTVNDINDPPILEDVSYLIDENTENGYLIASIEAIDPDNDELSYSILSGNETGAFELIATTGDLLVENSSLLDYETTPSFSLEVEVSDGNLTASATITIDLIDVDESVNQAPQISDQSFSVEENRMNGTLVGTIVAEDSDEDEILFSIISGNEDGAFELDATSGEISVTNSSLLDYETIPSFSLEVEVSDGNLTASATITIDLIDVDESVNQAPQISDQSFSVEENRMNGTLVGTIVAEDPDDDEILFSVTSGNEDGAFELDATSGEISVTNSSLLDYETTPSFSLEVEVSDGNLTASATITIDLIDVDEPVNRAPTIYQATFNLDENPTLGTTVGEIEAEDADNDPLLFSIVSGNESGAFEVMETTGLLKVADSIPIDYELNQLFQLDILVSDGVLSDNATVAIIINDIDESEVGVQSANLEFPIIYPNPFKDFITIKWTGFKKVELYDITGKIILTSENSTLVLGYLTSGIYYLNIYNYDLEYARVKIVKQ